MNSRLVTAFGVWNLAVGLVGLTAFPAHAVPSVAGQATQDWDRYQVILDRAPFGRAPVGVDPSIAADAAAAAAAAAEEQGPALADIVRLSVVTLYGGRPAAGFTDSTTGRSFYLFEGESVEDYTLVSVDASGSSVVLRKGAQEAELMLGAAPVAAVPAPVAISAAPKPGDTISYAARQRQRAEEARQRLEEARRRAEEERKNQEARVEQLTGEALQKHLRDYNMEMIRTGKGPPLPIELTQEEVSQLAAEGYDVTGQHATDPNAAPVPAPEAR